MLGVLLLLLLWLLLLWQVCFQQQSGERFACQHRSSHWILLLPGQVFFGQLKLRRTFGQEGFLLLLSEFIRGWSSGLLGGRDAGYIG